MSGPAWADLPCVTDLGRAVTDESVSVTTIISAPATAIFAILANPATHGAIDGTGWVREPLDGESLTASGQVFRMGMFHGQHPDGHYRVTNEVVAFDPPHAISWKPGQESEDGSVSFGGWMWRYDLTPAGPASTTVTLSYDWSEVPDTRRQHMAFPPFPADHLTNSLAHLSELAME